MNKLDILFVTDTSGSLDDERAGIADGITGLIAQLPMDLHFRIGVMLGHGSTSNHSGRLWHSSNGAVTMDSDTMTVRQIQTHLKSALTTGPDDGDSDGGEESLFSFYQGITEQLSDNRGKGLFREDAALAVVFITDENDICYPGTVPDPQHKEIPAYVRDCKGITAENILNAVKTVQGNRPFLLSGIVYTDPATTPSDGENEVAKGIIDLVKLSNGLLADIGKGHFADTLGSIGKLTVSKLMLKTEFVLGRTMVDPMSIVVKVDGKTVPFTFQPGLNEVQLKASDAGSYNSVISIYYCVKDGSGPYTPPGGNPGGGGGGDDEDTCKCKHKHKHKKKHHKHKQHDCDKDDDDDDGHGHH